MNNRTLCLGWIALMLGSGSIVHSQESRPVTTQPGKAEYTFRVEKDVAFLAPDRKEKCDLYLPTPHHSGERFPAIVVIHGGGWKRFDKADPRETNIASNLAGHGYLCMSINYFLGAKNETPWPQNLLDCKTAVQFLRVNADKYSIDADHIGVIGGSAGGHLSAMLGVLDSDAGLEPDQPYPKVSTRVQAVVNLYGVNNLEAHYSKPEEETAFRKVTNVIPQSEWKRASPLSHVSRNDPPMLLIHGTNDDTVPHQQSIELHEALKNAGVASECVILDGAPHSFHLQPKQRDLRPLVFGFFDRYLRPDPSLR